MQECIREFESHRFRQNAKRPQIGVVVAGADSWLPRWLDRLAYPSIDLLGYLVLGVTQQFAGVPQVHFAGGLGPDVAELEFTDASGQFRVTAAVATLTASLRASSNRVRSVH